MLYVLFGLFVGYVIFNEYTRKKEKQMFKKYVVENEKRFNEFEKYAYTDIRDLQEYLKKVKSIVKE
jgi:hypothetical protein